MKISEVRKITWRMALFACFMIASGTFIYAQIAYNSLRAHRTQARQVFLPSSDIVGLFSFGFKNFFADMFWIQSIQYIVTEGLLKDSYMAEYFDIVTTLDPYFEYPYLISNILLPRYATIQDAQRLSDRGIQFIPSSWQIPFYLGVQYHVVERDYANALRYLRIAEKRPDAPPIIRSLIASYTVRSGDIESGKALYEALRDTSENEYTRQVADAWIRQISVLESIRAASVLYKERYGSYPADMRALIRAGFFDGVPEGLENFTISIDPVSGFIQM